MKNDSALDVIAKLRAMGAVSASFHPDGALAQATFATPLIEPQPDEKPASTHQRLVKAERERLDELEKRLAMAVELGNA